MKRRTGLAARFMLLGVLAFATESMQATTLKINPTQIKLQVADKCTLQVVIDNATNLGGFQFDATFDSKVVQGDGANIGPFLGSTGRSVLPVGPDIDNASATGKITFAAATFGTTAGANGPGVIATLFFSAKEYGHTTIALTNQILTDPDGSVLSAATVSDGAMIVSSNINNIWKSQTSGVSSNLTCVDAVSDKVAWVAGSGGTVLVTVDGKTWKSAAGNLPALYYFSIDGLSNLMAIVTGFSQDPVSKVYTSSIYKTIDGGSTWAKKYEKVDAFINTIKMFDGRNGIAMADPLLSKWLILNTTDSGEIWSAQANAPAQKEDEFGNRGCFWLDKDHGWFGTSKARAYAWSGNSWTELPIPPLDQVNALCFDDFGWGLAASTNSGKLVRSKNWGSTWDELIPPESPTSYLTIFKQRFWLTAKKNIYQSSDLGSSWNLDATSVGNIGQPSFVEVASEVYGWAVGRNGTIMSYMPQSVDVHSEAKDNTPQQFTLCQNYPNPFNAGTCIVYHLPIAAQANLSIINLGGQTVRRYELGMVQPGSGQIVWDGKDEQGEYVPSGLYISALETSSWHQSRKMLLIK